MCWLIYGSFSHWGFLLGRPFRINVEDRTIPKPGDDFNSAEVYASWSPYGLPCFTSFPDGRSITFPVALISHFRISLCEIMSSLGGVLYVIPPIPLFRDDR